MERNAVPTTEGPDIVVDGEFWLLAGEMVVQLDAFDAERAAWIPG